MKGTRGSVAGAIGKKKAGAGAPTGAYLLHITNSLTPLIGTVSSSTGLTIVGGALTVQPNTDGVLNLSGIPTFNFVNDSWFVALSVSIEAIDDMAGFALRAAAQDMASAVFDGGSGTAFPQIFGGIYAPGANVPGLFQGGNDEFRFCLAYDAQADRVRAWINAVSVWDQSGVPGFATGGFNQLVLEGQNAPLATVGYRNIHVIRFPGQGLPNVTSMLSAYLASPAAKLAAWAT